MFAIFRKRTNKPKESDEEYVERIRGFLVSNHKTRRAMIWFHVAMVVVFFALWICVPMLLLKIGQLWPGGGMGGVMIGGFVLGTLLGLLMAFHLAHSLGQLMLFVNADCRDKKLMLRYHDALKEIVSATVDSEPRPSGSVAPAP